MIKIDFLIKKSEKEEETQTKSFQDMSSAISWCMNNHDKIVQIGECYTFCESLLPYELFKMINSYGKKE